MSEAKSGFTLPPEFQEDARAPLIEPNATDSTEFWLIQLPKDQMFDFDGQQLSLELKHNAGQLGSFEGSSGKSYNVVSSAEHEAKATVFLSSAEDSKIVGNITRRVSFVHYMDPSEVPKDDTKKLKQYYERSNATSLTKSHYTTPSKGIRPGPLISASGRTTTHSSARKSSLSEEKVRSKSSKSSRSSHDSGHVHGSGNSHEKAKKRKKHEA